MNNKLFVMYRSKTGFTREYAEMIAEELGCALMDVKDASAQTLSAFETIIFGGRIHAGVVDGLSSAKKLCQQSQAARLIVFATGATPNEAEDTIQQMWANNLTPAERREIPHFYMQGGLRYERMPLSDKLMMKAFRAMVRKKKNKNEYEKQMEKAVAASFDFSSRQYIAPLLLAVQSAITGNGQEG